MTAQRVILAGILAAVITPAAWAADAPKDQVVRTKTVAAPAPDSAIQRWREARVGMFIHWGPVTLKGTEISWTRGNPVPVEEYDNLYKQFNPVKFNAEEWVSIAKAAGMKYVVLVTKHHDGFCLWDTKQTEHNIMNSPFKRDITKEISDACKKQGIAFGTYYSTADWHHPDFPVTSPGGKTKREKSDIEAYTKYLKAQVGELLKNYGPLFTLWFDLPQYFDPERGAGVINFARSIQPDVMINARTGAPGDYSISESRTGGFNMVRPWETCMTISRSHWSWDPKDIMKSLEECLKPLIITAGGDGNYLFNITPEPTGSIELRQVERLKEMGAWLGKYGETIYGTRGGPYEPTWKYASTRKGNVVYLHLFRWNEDRIELPPFNGEILESNLLDGGRVTIKNEKTGLIIQVPQTQRQEIDTIVKLVVKGNAMDLAPIKAIVKVKASASNVYKNIPSYNGGNAVDDNPDTCWATDKDQKSAWLKIDFDEPRVLTGVVIEEAGSPCVKKFTIEYYENGTWKPLLAGDSLGGRFNPFRKSFDPVKAQTVRLNILEAVKGPSISEVTFEQK